MKFIFEITYVYLLFASGISVQFRINQITEFSFQFKPELHVNYNKISNNKTNIL